MSAGLGLAQGIRAGQSLIDPWFEGKRQREAFNRRAALQGLAEDARMKRLLEERGYKESQTQKAREQIGKALQSIRGEELGALDPVQLGLLQEEGMLNSYLKELKTGEEEAKKQKVLQQIMQESPELAQQIQFSQAGLKDVLPQYYLAEERKQKGLTEKQKRPLSLENLRARTGASRASAGASAARRRKTLQDIERADYETVKEDTDTGSLTYKRPRSQSGASGSGIRAITNQDVQMLQQLMRPQRRALLPGG